MREIKFRCFIEWANVMLNVAIIDNMRSEIHCFNETGKKNPCDRYALAEVTLLQYTGFNDKNSVEIYEGDILSGRKKNNYYVVFENGAFYLYYTNTKDWEGNNQRWGLLSRLFDVDMKDLLPFFEVIGNIHENSDFLKQGAEDE